MILQELMKNFAQSPKTRTTPKKHLIQQSNTITNYFNVKQPLASAYQANHQQQFENCGKAIKRERENTFYCSLPKKIKQDCVTVNDIIVISDSDDNCDEDRNNNIHDKMEKGRVSSIGRETNQVSLPPNQLFPNLERNTLPKLAVTKKEILVSKTTNRNIVTFEPQATKANYPSSAKQGHKFDRNIWTDLPDIMDNLHGNSPSKNNVAQQLGKNRHDKIAVCDLKKGKDVSGKNTKPTDEQPCLKTVTENTISSDNNVKANFSCVSIPAKEQTESDTSGCSSSEASDGESIFADGDLNPLWSDMNSSESTDDEDSGDLPEFIGNSIKTTTETSKIPCSVKQNSLEICGSTTCSSTPPYFQNPCLNLEGTVFSSQESNCSISPVLEKLQRAALTFQPITPRHGKKLCISTEGNGSLDNSPNIEDGTLEPKRRKLHFSLKRMIRDKKKNEKLDLMEKKLLANIKKGGFNHYIDHSSDEEDDRENEIQNEHLDVLSRIASSKDDCMSLPNTHCPVNVINSESFCSLYCPHTLHHCEKSLSLNKSNIVAMLQLLRTGRIKEMLHRKLCGKMETLSFLLKVLCTSSDDVLLKCAFNGCAHIIKDQNVMDCHLQQLDEAILNIGVKRKMFHSVHKQTKKQIICKRCKTLKPPLKVLLKNLLHVIKVVTTISRRWTNRLTDHFIAPYLKLCCLLLTNTHSNSLHVDFQNALTSLILAVNDWPSVRSRTTREVVEIVEEMPTLDYIVSSFPTVNERCLELKRSIAQASLYKFLNPTLSSPYQPTPVMNFDLTPIVEFANQLEVQTARAYVKSRNPTASTRDVYHTLYACIAILQASIKSCVPTNKLLRKKHLENISTSLRSLSVSIRDNGCLFASEVKHFIRIVIANVHLQVQAMPSTRNYQENIFKFLGSSRVDERVVGEAMDETEDEINSMRLSSRDEPMDTSTTSNDQLGPLALTYRNDAMQWESFKAVEESSSDVQHLQPLSVNSSVLPTCSIEHEVKELVCFLVDSTSDGELI
uniref:Uncharacterized protein LOC100183911 n=1 Tax=Phallusia mammillata TaxID=59560 RepID=A0A6F9DHD8_9ASCI|nr:uncharacterized protein LOC100183911 [Phallusia mammillata]